MLSEKEIADYVHGQPRLPGTPQFAFSELNKMQDTPTRGWQPLTDPSDGDSGPAGRITEIAKVHKAKHVLSWLRKGGVRTASVTKRNFFLIMLFVVVFAAAFVLESRRVPAKPGHAFSRSNSTEVQEVVKRP